MIRIIIVTLSLIFVCSIVFMMYCCLIVASREDDILERMLENERFGKDTEKQEKEEH